MALSFDEKFFIAGHCGMVGSAMVRMLRDSMYISKPGQLITCTRNELNLLNTTLVDQFFDVYRPSIVVLAAAKVGGILANSKNLSDFYYENIQIQNNVINASMHYGVKRFVFLGSSCIYPITDHQPMSESELLNGPLESTNEAYALAKICGIKYCQYLRSEKSFDAISIMPCNLYGLNDNYDTYSSHVLAAMIRRFLIAKEENKQSVTCWGSGNPRREFLYVDDLASAILLCLESWNPPKNQLPWINVGSSSDISIASLAENIAKACDYGGLINWDKSKPDGIQKKLMDSSKMRALGWKPQYSLEDGLHLSIADYKRRFNIFTASC